MRSQSRDSQASRHSSRSKTPKRTLPPHLAGEAAPGAVTVGGEEVATFHSEDTPAAIRQTIRKGYQKLKGAAKAKASPHPPRDPTPHPKRGEKGSARGKASTATDEAATPNRKTRRRDRQRAFRKANKELRHLKKLGEQRQAEKGTGKRKVILRK